jgi:hypothetical protein
MSRSLKVSRKHIPKVKLALKTNGFVRQVDLATDLNLSLSTIGKFFNGKPIDYSNFVEICFRLNIEWQNIADLNDAYEDLVIKKGNQNYQYWDEAPDVTLLYDRDDELKTLKQWILEDRCRIVQILGLSGIGKTALAAKLIKQKEIEEEFDYVVWCNFREVISLDSVLQDWLKIFDPQISKFPDSIFELINYIINCFRSSRCLLILDNIVSIFETNTFWGKYKPEYKQFGDLLTRIAESSHQSCLLLINSELPQEIFILEGIHSPVRLLKLQGINVEYGQKIVEEKGNFVGDRKDWQILISNYYSGHPLALKIVASTILNLSGGDLAKFIEEILRKNNVVFGKIIDVLDAQFERLTAIEKDIIYWLAINQEPISVEVLEEDLILQEPQQNLLEALISLTNRSFIETEEHKFTLQNIVREYLISKFCQQIIGELETNNFHLFKSHSLIKSTSKEWIKKSKKTLLLSQLQKK